MTLRQQTPLSGAWVVELELLGDERGCFARTFDAEEFAARGLNPAVVQCNTSFNARARHAARHALPGRAARRGQARALRARRDLRRGRRPARRLADATAAGTPSSSAPRTAWRFYIPPGLAHGFQTLTDDTEVLYQMGDPYVPEAARGVRWDDPAFAIDWPQPSGRARDLRERRAYPDFET